VRGYRIGLGVAGVALLALGLFRLVTELDRGDLVALVVWLVAAVALHDGLVAPVTVGTGVALTRLPARARRYVQGALVVGALVVVVAIPLIGRQGTQPEAKAILLRNYSGNLALMLGLTAAVAVLLYAVRVVRDRRAASPSDEVGSVD
jgi:hypothetical protein